jgi:hypothetical protein
LWLEITKNVQEGPHNRDLPKIFREALITETWFKTARFSRVRWAMELASVATIATLAITLGAGLLRATIVGVSSGHRATTFMVDSPP